MCVRALNECHPLVVGIRVNLCACVCRRFKFQIPNGLCKSGEILKCSWECLSCSLLSSLNFPNDWSSSLSLLIKIPSFILCKSKIHPKSYFILVIADFKYYNFVIFKKNASLSVITDLTIYSEYIVGGRQPGNKLIRPTSPIQSDLLGQKMNSKPTVDWYWPLIKASHCRLVMWHVEWMVPK